jgi:hypothetical protein
MGARASRMQAHRSGKHASPEECTPPPQTPPKTTSDTSQSPSKSNISADKVKQSTQRNHNAKIHFKQLSSGAVRNADTEQNKHHRRLPKHGCIKRQHRSAYWFSRNATLLWLCILCSLTWSTIFYSPSCRHTAGLTNPLHWPLLPTLHLTRPSLSWRNSTNPSLCFPLPTLRRTLPPPSWRNAAPSPRCRWSRSTNRPPPAPPDAPSKLQLPGRSRRPPIAHSPTTNAAPAHPTHTTRCAPHNATRYATFPHYTPLLHPLSYSPIPTQTHTIPTQIPHTKLHTSSISHKTTTQNSHKLLKWKLTSQRLAHPCASHCRYCTPPGCRNSWRRGNDASPRRHHGRSTPRRSNPPRPLHLHTTSDKAPLRTLRSHTLLTHYPISPAHCRNPNTYILHTTSTQSHSTPLPTRNASHNAATLNPARCPPAASTSNMHHLQNNLAHSNSCSPTLLSQQHPSQPPATRCPSHTPNTQNPEPHTTNSTLSQLTLPHSQPTLLHTHNKPIRHSLVHSSIQQSQHRSTMPPTHTKQHKSSNETTECCHLLTRTRAHTNPVRHLLPNRSHPSSIPRISYNTSHPITTDHTTTQMHIITLAHHSLQSLHSTHTSLGDRSPPPAFNHYMPHNVDRLPISPIHFTATPTIIHTLPYTPITAHTSIPLHQPHRATPCHARLPWPSTAPQHKTFPPAAPHRKTFPHAALHLSNLPPTAPHPSTFPLTAPQHTVAAHPSPGIALHRTVYYAQPLLPPRRTTSTPHNPRTDQHRTTPPTPSPLTPNQPSCTTLSLYINSSIHTHIPLFNPPTLHHNPSQFSGSLQVSHPASPLLCPPLAQHSRPALPRSPLWLRRRASPHPAALAALAPTQSTQQVSSQFRQPPAPTNLGLHAF